PACTSDSNATQCNGTCDGNNRMSCSYPTVSCSYCSLTLCGGIFGAPGVRTGSCSNGICTGTTSCCHPYTCHGPIFMGGGPACWTSCGGSNLRCDTTSVAPTMCSCMGSCTGVCQ